MTVLWITQMDADGENDSEICRLDVGDDMWGRLHRIFTPAPRSLDAFDVLVTQMDGNGENIICEKPLVIPYHRGLWLLQDFFKAPERTWKKVKIPEED